MTERRRGLGRGLGALIPTAPVDGNGAPPGVDVDGDRSSAPAVPSVYPSSTVSRETTDSVDDLVPVDGATFAEIPVAAIAPNSKQPRQDFDEEAMEELAFSIREIGLLQPIVVRRLDGDRYELVMGERRWRASQRAGLTAIPAIVRSTSDDDMLRDALLENLHRSQLNPLEEAAAYQQLLDDFSCTHDELAGRIGRSRPQISNTLRLLRLPPLVQRRVAAGILSAGHARALLGLSDGGAQERLAQRIVAEGLSVRSVEEIVAIGDDATPSTKPRRGPKPVAPRLTDIADALSERLETRVKVDLGRNKGKVTIEFASIDDLDRIVGAIDPSLTPPKDTSAP
ncbi:ParB/RepB/Spo0J family partition protein [Phytoactinopolyspora limicola]|uniref:ParB/RepB/Spo0J family partition protein n=1 Tax=Phytoactinopolyspora limicola TaxID=2715536 RepID=UPI00140C42A6